MNVNTRKEALWCGGIRLHATAVCTSVAEEIAADRCDQPSPFQWDRRSEDRRICYWSTSLEPGPLVEAALERLTGEVSFDLLWVTLAQLQLESLLHDERLIAS